MLEEWSENARQAYASVDFETFTEWLYPTTGPFDLSEERYTHIAKLKQAALEAARKTGADYLLVSN